MTNGRLFSLEAASVEETCAIAQRLAPLLRRGDCIALAGDLGAGKTEFARALIRALAQDALLEVTSPTFTLMQNYPVMLAGKEAACWHADLYRVENPAELIELGLEEAAQEGILVVEWPEIAAHSLPPEQLYVQFEREKTEARRLKFFGDASWQLRLSALYGKTS